jgi:transcription factor IIIB subunit 2
LENVCVSCLYVICRKKKTPYFLIDFADITQIPTYKMGAMFLKFIRLCHVVDLPIVDPSLFVHRFLSRLALGNKFDCVARSSLRLIARMKRAWMNSGRRPAGLCGAAILLATKMHGIQKTQKEISEVVRIGDMVLRTRLREIEQTSIATLTLKEVESGGGDDGDRNSLLDYMDAGKPGPPSFRKISKNKALELHLEEGSAKARIFQNKKKKKTKWEPKKNKKPLPSSLPSHLVFPLGRTPEKRSFPTPRISHPFFFPVGQVKECSDIRDIPEDSLLYFNSPYEMFIKENLWNEINVQFLFAHSIVNRAQKEKPFAYFRMKHFTTKKKKRR